MGGIIMGITIRKATATDLDAVSGIYDRIHDEIEAVYHPHVDFAGVQALARAHIETLKRKNPIVTSEKM